MPDPWWICATCNSLNRQKARKCYSCGTANAAGQAEVIDLLDSGFIGRRGPGAPPPPAAVKPADAAAKGAVDTDRLRPGGLAELPDRTVTRAGAGAGRVGDAGDGL